ncbi:MAG: helix-turn-helix transcriptional regulator [Clostridia bacterium]|nr:helix-turn-helix transcriptional regulator [Clostridia bacterium]
MAYSISYYRESGKSHSDIALSDRAIVVNCTGQVVLRLPYSANRPQGRRDYYLIYCTGGGMRIRLAGEECYMRAGDLAILPPGEGYFYDFSGEGELFYYWAHFTGSSAEEYITRAGLTVDKLMTVGLDEDLAAAFRSLMDSFMIIDAQHEEEAAGHLLVLLAIMGRAAVNKPVRLATERVKRSLGYMVSHYSEEVIVTDLAAMEFMSVSHDTNLFRTCTGFSPKEYLIRLRMHSAMEMLTRSDMSIAQISVSVGYNDPHYFSRLFK